MERSRTVEDRQKVWTLIKDSHVAVLVTMSEAGGLDSRPLGCVQRKFDGELWFLTFKHSHKLEQIARDAEVLVSYANPKAYRFVSISGRARVVEDLKKIEELWSERYRLWFPMGPADPHIALIAIQVHTARYWTRPASILTYASAYVRARLSGHSASPELIAEIKQVDFN